jgi:geranylgeranyl diphosphate synthase type I
MALHIPVLTELQQRYGGDIDSSIERWLSTIGSNDLFSGMMRYQLGTVDEDLRPTDTRGGKRFRPALCLLACESVGGAWHSALPVAAGVELLHNFSLIHDDIEDRDAYRRHRRTVWKRWGEPQAINAGDGMFALATRAVASVQDTTVALQLVQRFQDTALSLTRGQYLDMSFESRHDVSADEYLEMISLKTAAIIQFTAWAGAVIGGAEPRVSQALGRFGEDLGRAFQIADDILGVWGSPQRTGKEPASDVRNRKKTLPVLLALQQSAGASHDILQRFYTGASDDVEPVLQVLEDAGVRAQSVSVASDYSDKAVTWLRAAHLSPDAAGLMENLVVELTQG